MSALDDEARATLRRFTRDGWLSVIGCCALAVGGTIVLAAVGGLDKQDGSSEDWWDIVFLLLVIAIGGVVTGVSTIRRSQRMRRVLKTTSWSVWRVRMQDPAATRAVQFEISEDGQEWASLTLHRASKDLQAAIRAAEHVEIAATKDAQTSVLRPPGSPVLHLEQYGTAASGRQPITGWPRPAFQVGITVALVLVAALEIAAVDQANLAHRRAVALDHLIYDVGPQADYRTGERLEDEARKSFITLTVAAVVIALLALALTITFVILVRRRPKHARLTPWTHAWTWLAILGCATAFVATCVTSGASPWRDAASEATNPAIMAAVFALAFVPIVWCAPRRVTTTSGL